MPPSRNVPTNNNHYSSFYVQIKKHGRQQIQSAGGKEEGCEDKSGSSIHKGGMSVEQVSSSPTGSAQSQTSSSTANNSASPSTFTLLSYFLQEFGPATSEQFMESQKNFVQSCAG